MYIRGCTSITDKYIRFTKVKEAFGSIDLAATVNDFEWGLMADLSIVCNLSGCKSI